MAFLLIYPYPSIYALVCSVTASKVTNTLKMFCYNIDFIGGPWFCLFLLLLIKLPKQKVGIWKSLGTVWALVAAKIKSFDKDISAATFCCTLKQHLCFKSQIFVGTMPLSCYFAVIGRIKSFLLNHHHHVACPKDVFIYIFIFQDMKYVMQKCTTLNSQTERIWSVF